MAKKKKSKEDENFSESKSDELKEVMKERAKIEQKLKEFKKKRVETMEREKKIRIIINTLGGDK